MAQPFRLARILAIRTQLRRLIQDEVALLGAQLATLRAEAAAARDAQTAVRTAVETATCAGVSGAELVQYGAWEQALGRREAKATAAGARVAEAIVRGRNELLARRQDERKLERLRERAAARGQAAQAHEHALLIDDYVLRRGR